MPSQKIFQDLILGEISRDSEGLEETLNEMGVQTDLDDITPEMEQELSKATTKSNCKRV